MVTDRAPPAARLEWGRRRAEAPAAKRSRRGAAQPRWRAVGADRVPRPSSRLCQDLRDRIRSGIELRHGAGSRAGRARGGGSQFVGRWQFQGGAEFAREDQFG